MIIQKHFKSIALAAFMLALSTSFSAHAETTFFEAGNARVAWHDGGIKIAPAFNDNGGTDYIFHRNTSEGILVTGAIAGILRASLVPLEHRLLNDNTKPAAIKKALISLIRCVEEICYILTHPDDEDRKSVV